jgi:hypothetical protein
MNGAKKTDTKFYGFHEFKDLFMDNAITELGHICEYEDVSGYFIYNGEKYEFKTLIIEYMDLIYSFIVFRANNFNKFSSIKVKTNELENEIIFYI